MAHKIDDGSDIPERDDAIDGEFVDADNDKVKESRQGHFVDTEDAVRVGGQLLGGQLLASPNRGAFPFDSDLGRFGQAGIARLDVLTDDEAW